MRNKQHHPVRHILWFISLYALSLLAIGSFMWLCHAIGRGLLKL